MLQQHTLSVLIVLPGATRYTLGCLPAEKCTERPICAVCGNMWCSDLAVKCANDGCSCAVHEACAGQLERDATGAWYCWRRECSGKLPQACALCLRTGGMQRRAESGQSAVAPTCHILCAIYIREVRRGAFQVVACCVLTGGARSSSPPHPHWNRSQGSSLCPKAAAVPSALCAVERVEQRLCARFLGTALLLLNCAHSDADSRLDRCKAAFHAVCAAEHGLLQVGGTQQAHSHGGSRDVIAPSGHNGKPVGRVLPRTPRETMHPGPY